MPPQRPTILVVDDHEDSRTICRSFLQHRGFVVMEAEDGAQALQLARKRPPDLVLLDLSLPVLDGWSVLSQLKDNALTARIPVVAVTAQALPADEERVRAAGFDGYLPKPCRLRDILAEVDRHLQPSAVHEGAALAG